MAEGAEDALFRIAINESVQPNTTRSVPDQLTGPDQSAGEASEQNLPSRLTIDDMIGRLASRNTTRLPCFDDPMGDTWIFIDATPQQPEQDQIDYDDYLKRCATPFQLKRETLMRLNSPIINDSFGPTAQYRLLRRRSLVDKLPQGIKYVIDLTPPSEGEDAVWLISSLSCSEGVRLWYQSQDLFSVLPQLVGGEEEYASGRSNDARATKSEDTKKTDSAISPNSDSLADPAPTSNTKRCIRNTPKVPEYSPIRHRAAIERLLACAAGTDPKLDSAPKLWTTFAVARHFGIVRSPLTDYIVTWLRTHPNSMFLEVLTEVSQIMADQLEVYDLERDTFAMLVGEEALDNIVRSRSPNTNRTLSTFGRKKEDLPEHIQTRVEYASKNFTERVVADFEDLRSARWIESLPEIQNLSSFTQPELQVIISDLKKTLKDWLQGTILHVQRSCYEDIPRAEIPAFGGENLIPRLDRKLVFQSLNPEERILTRTFWNALETLDIFRGLSNLDILTGWQDTAVLASFYEEPSSAVDGYYRVHVSFVHSIIDAGQYQLDRARLLNYKTTQINHLEKTLAPAPNESSYVPLEVARRFPPLKNLAIRPKLLPEPVLRTSAIAPVAEEETSLADEEISVHSDSQASSSYFGWPAMDGLAEWAASLRMLESPKGSARDAWAPWIPSHFPGKENELPESATTGGKPFADWTKALHRRSSIGDDWSDMSDTAPLLQTTDEASEKTGSNFRNDTPDEKQGTKRPSKPSHDEWNTVTASLTSISDLRSPKNLKFPERQDFFNLSNFFSEARDHVRMIARLKLSYTDAFNGRKELHELNLINTLVCLDDPEFKYLPLWAGGCDDDSGGVFNDDVAIPDISFATAGPSIKHGAGMHTVSECDTVSNNGALRGIATPASSVPSSEYHLIDDTASTILPFSNHTTAGYSSDKLNSNRIYAADSVDDSSASGDHFSIVASSEGLNPDDEEENAHREIEAIERIEAADAEAAWAARQMRGASSKDENYADLFCSEDEGDASDDTVMEFEDDDDDDWESG